MILQNSYLELPARFYSKSQAEKFSQISLIAFNSALAKELNLNLESSSEQELAAYFSGQKLLPGSQPISQTYAAHQFGHFVPQLGDGRAMLLGEACNPMGKNFDIQLKGSGRTEYSRNGDGFSAIGPVLREYIVSEAMHRLSVPTTRALAAVATGDYVYREYPIPGAVFTRVASSHIRIGSFQFFAAREDTEALQLLFDYAAKRHYPDIFTAAKETQTNLQILFLRNIMQKQISLVSKWMGLGFIHGVMNTDNISISGETIDYGPCAFMDQFAFDKHFSFIDRNGRYCYQNQAPILKWNLSRLADCLVPIMQMESTKAVGLLTEELANFDSLFEAQLIQEFSNKFAIEFSAEKKQENNQLIKLWLNYLETEKLDFTQSFRFLSDLLELDFLQNSSTELKLSPQQQEVTDFFKPSKLLEDFLSHWKKLLNPNTDKLEEKQIKEIQTKLSAINPLYIPRNHQIERAIERAMDKDFSIFHELNQVLAKPYTKHADLDNYKEAPLTHEEVQNTFCGT